MRSGCCATIGKRNRYSYNSQVEPTGPSDVAPPIPAGDGHEFDRVKLDYDQTFQYFRMLADIRFKLLGFVPTITGAAVATLNGVAGPGAVAAGVLGFLATFGLLLYELRNTQLYDAALSRLQDIESRLGFRSVHGGHHGGTVSERPWKPARFWGINASHRWGLGIIYSGSLAGWAFLVASRVSDLVWVPGAVGGAVFAAAAAQYARIERRSQKS